MKDKIYNMLKKNKKLKKFVRKLRKGRNGKTTYSLEEICKIIGVKVPKEFDDVKKIKRDCTAKQSAITDNAVYFALYEDEFQPDFYQDVLEKNVIVIISNNAYKRFKLGRKYKVIVVNDIINTACKFFNHVKNQYKAKTIAITGSVGKTTTTQLLNCVVSKEFNTLCNKGNMNSYGAVSNYIMNHLKKKNEVYIQECGAGNFNSVRKSAAMLQPDAYILTNVLPHHLNTYKTIENVFEDKTSFSDYMNKNGIVFANFDDEKIANHEFPHKVISFGINTKKEVDYRAINIEQNREHLEFDIVYDKSKTHIKINILGEHNVLNALGVFAACKWLGISDDAIACNLLSFRTKGVRQNLINIAGVAFLLDCYNIAGASIKATMKVLEEMKVSKGNKKIVILGGENKLGKNYYDITYKLGTELSSSKVDYIICCSFADGSQKEIDFYGESKPIYQALKDNGFKNCMLVTSRDDIAGALKKLLKPGDVCLVKANYELDTTMGIDELFGSSITMDYETIHEREKIVKNDNFEMRVNDDFKKGSLISYIGKKSNILKIPDKVDGYKVFRVSKKLFKGYKNIETIDFGNSLYNIGIASFYGCNKLKKLNFPSNVKFVSERAFASCTSLQDVNIEEGMCHIARRAFKDCVSLKNIKLPKSIGYIEEEVFLGCDNVIINCYKNSVAYQYAKENNIEYKIIK